MKKKYNLDKWIKAFVAFAVVIVFIVVNIYVLQDCDLEENPMTLHVLGISEVLMGMILQYYFGSSKSSSDKNKLLNKNMDEDENVSD